MRVAYVCADPGIPVFGTKGASVHVQGVVTALRRAGHEVVLLCARPGGDPPPALADLPVLPLPRPAKGGDLAARERAGMEANAALHAALDAAGPLDLVLERASLWSHAGMAWAREHGVPGVLEVNAPLPREQAAHRGLVHADAAMRTARRAAHDATAVVAVSRAVAAWVRDDLGVPAGRVHVVPNGVDPERVAGVRPEPGRPFTVGFVGTLKPWHGLEVLARAFALLRRRRPAARLLVVGDGPGRADLEHRLARSGQLRATTLTGAVDPAQVRDHLARMDVAVAPYPADVDMYFSPLKVVEALAAGVPVVASAIGDVPLLVRDGVTGLLVPPGDHELLAAALDHLAARPALRARLGAAGRASARTWDDVAAEVLAAALPLEAAA